MTKSVAYLPSLRDKSKDLRSTKMRREFELSRIMKSQMMDNSMKAETETKYEMLKLR
jgi:hypothetical protein